MLKNFGFSDSSRKNTVASRPPSSNRSTLLSHRTSIFSTLSRASTAATEDDISVSSYKHPRDYSQHRSSMSVHSSDSIRSAPLRTNTSLSALSNDVYAYRSSSISDPNSPALSHPNLSRSNTSDTVMGSSSLIPLSPPHTPGVVDVNQFPTYPPSNAEKQAARNAMNQHEATINVVYASDVTHDFERSRLSRTKKEYVVLTNQHLLRFKNQQKANQSLDLFASNQSRSIPVSPPSKIFTSKDHFMLRVDNIIAIHAVGGAPYTFRIDYVADEEARQVSSINFTVVSSSDRLKWMDRLRSLTRVYLPRTHFVSRQDRLRGTHRLSRHKDIPDNNDEIVMHKAIFRYKRLKSDNSGQYKELFATINVALGKFSIYILPNEQSDEDHINTVGRDRYGFLALQSMTLDGNDDTLRLKFRQVQADSKIVELATSHCEELLQDIRRAIHSLVPLYPTPPYQLIANDSIQNVRMLPMTDISKIDDFGFNRLLEAYCAAFNLNKARFNYVVDSTADTEDGLSLELHPANEIGESTPLYTRYELLAFMRSLRHNTTFRKISFANVDLSEINSWSGKKDDGWTVSIEDGQHVENVLASELYTLILHNKKLRGLDLSDCNIGGSKHTHSPISVIGTVLQSKQTGLNSLHLKNNTLSANDVDALARGILVARKAIRELVVSGCGLDAMQIDTILQAVYMRSPGHMKYLDISSNTSNISVAQVDGIFRRCNRLDHIRLRNCGYLPDPMTLDLTKLETLDLGLTPLSDEHVLTLCQWIITPSFANIKSLHLDGCGLHAGHVRDILIAIARSKNMAIHVDFSQNPIFRHTNHLPRLWYAIMQSYTPLSMGFRDLEWDENSLQEFLDSMMDNETLVKLDLSGMRVLPSSRQSGAVGPDTIKKLATLFERNKKLQELHLSGGEDENGTRIGLGKAMSSALSALAYNTVLKKLVLRGVRFGDVGITALADVIKVNQTITYLDIEDNSVTIDGYRMLNEALMTNNILMTLPRPRIDLRNQIAQLKEAIRELTLAENETRYIIANSGGSDTRRARLQLQVQVRSQAESAMERITSEVDKVMAAIDRNKKLWERVQAQVRLQAQQPYVPRNDYADHMMNDLTDTINMFGINPPVLNQEQRTPPSDVYASVPWTSTGFSDVDYITMHPRSASSPGTPSEHSSVGSQFVPYNQPYNKPDSVM
ncbi:hypothetical protein K450DRAFT_195950 [Umbelopsis ramanniana AG]|uniref:PH domain-containing protein n=1 Tax=Umbelopsis ramanniana AG TaxID=1314678 RepID=A0AAD5EII2_UMBRA|nr:uncharacterized protein K450DRAFT_195950 [Umbelopsis ramanniana AG]KAI8583670.1 hypothetical protein K450DRAFT_195950 [Umbelopsis ramanniana AG]